MGNIGDQEPRNRYDVSVEEIDSFLADASRLAKKHSITVETVIGAFHVMEMSRRSSILVQGGDYHDEHIDGLAGILSRIADGLANITDASGRDE